MVRMFLKERLSWILLIVFFQILLVFLAYLDISVSMMSILYFILLSSIIFLFFLIIRYQKETKFYKSIKDWEGNLNITNLIEGESPFELLIEKMISSQTEFLKEQASKNKHALEEEKDEMLSWIHEVKTPLTAMKLIIDRLEDEKIKSQLNYEWLRIHLLLDWKLHQERLPFLENDLYIEKINLRELIVKEIKTLQTWCMQKGIGFDVDLRILEVESDAKWLSFILRQILTNAVKYSESSDIIIKSYVEDGHKKIQITDFGRGIEKKDLPRIFEKGFTSTSNHHDHAATGMGLYLAKKIAGGLFIDIGVQSKFGEGTTFTLTFSKSNEFVQITSM